MDNSIGIYIHIPFCKSKCYYCDFNSYSGREHLAGSYFDALFSEIKHRAGSVEGRPVRSIFIGGGTPSLVDPKYITGLLELCSKYLMLDTDAEISMESNPGTLTYENLKLYRAAGVNRLSIGLQAWQDRLLKDLGRIHSRQQYVENLDAAYRAGFRNINTDLIFGLPGQTLEDWADTLEAVTSLQSLRAGDKGGEHERAEELNVDSASPLTHLSCYDLKIEEGTVFGDQLAAGRLKPAEDELDRQMYHYTVETLAMKGFRQYEISNFSRPGYECKHNLVYWKAREYAGFGAGAHSFLNSTRFSNVPGIEQYIEAVRSELQSYQQKEKQKKVQKEIRNAIEADSQTDPRKDVQIDPQIYLQTDTNTDPRINMQFIDQAETRLIDSQEAMSEFMILGLRLTDGVFEKEFAERFGHSLRSIYGKELDNLVRKGLIIFDENSNSYRLSVKGLDFANEAFMEFI